MDSFSFAPIININSKVLILGTMPGVKSLEDAEYYAHKRNAFWRIIFDIFNESYSDNFKIKLRILLKHRLSLWDILKYCYREGSLDSNIIKEKPNDISKFLTENSNIKTIIFNGKSAEKLFKKYFSEFNSIKKLQLPSTSPANARISFKEKLEKWYIIKDL